MLNQLPQKIVRTNRLPFLVGFMVLTIVMAVFMYKAQMNQRAVIVQNKPRQSIDISQKEVEATWFNDEKFRNIKIGHNESSSHKQTAREIESQTISKQEVDLRKLEIEDEYSTRLEIKKIEDKDRIE